MLAAYAHEHPTTWDLYLPAVLMAYNTSVASSSGETPFFLIHGRDPVLPVDLLFGETSPSISSYSDYGRRLTIQLRSAFQLAQQAIAGAQSTYVLPDVRREQLTPKYDINQRVWLYCPQVKKGMSKKIRLPWTGPYRITARLDGPVYEICPLNGAKKFRVHTSRLKPFCDRYVVVPSLPTE